MAGELAAMLKIVEGVRELGKSLVTDEAQRGAKKDTAPTAPRYEDPRVTVEVPRELVDNILVAARELEATAPTLLLKPINELERWLREFAK